MENYFENILIDLFNDLKKNHVIIHSKEGNWHYRTKLLANFGDRYVYEEDHPLSINIPDFHLLEQKTEQYLIIARDFYKEDKAYYEIEGYDFDKHLLFFLVTNMTTFDANNIYNFVGKRTTLLESSKQFAGQSFVGRYSDEQKADFDIYVKVGKNRSNMESPLKFEVCLQKDNQKFILPTIHFGIDGERALIAGVQNLHTRQDGEFAKKLDRYFRKVNKNIDAESVEANVSPNAVVVMGFFLEFLQKTGIKNVDVPDYMPLRYSSSLECRKEKAKRQQTTMEEVYQSLDRDQYNMTNKLMYLMLRMGAHFDNLEVDYNDIKNQMEIKILNNQHTKTDNIIHNICESVKYKSNCAEKIR